jgi:hypothetical protein
MAWWSSPLIPGLGGYTLSTAIVRGWQGTLGLSMA